MPEPRARLSLGPSTDLLTPRPRERVAFTTAFAERSATQRALGRSGMATLHLARDFEQERVATLKALDPQRGTVPGAKQVLAEIRVGASPQRPNSLPPVDGG